MIDILQTNIHHWCLPDGATYDMETNIINVESGHTEAEAIQAPYSLHRSKLLLTFNSIRSIHVHVVINVTMS